MNAGQCDIDAPLVLIASAASEALPCGPHVVSTLEEVLSTLKKDSSEVNASTIKLCGAKCAKLVIKASEAIAVYPYSEVPTYWRRVYMDASLLQVLSTLRAYRSARVDDPQEILPLVRILDMANIITGYLENGRKEAFFTIMHQVQQRLEPDSVDNVKDDRPRKRRRGENEGLSEERQYPYALLPNIAYIKRYDCLEDAPDMFSLGEVREPFIISKGISHWPAMSDPNTSWKKASYLLKVAGRGRIVPVEVGSSYTSEGWTQKMMDFTDFLDKIDWEESKSRETDEPVLYLAQHDLFQQFPALLSDVIPPDYVFSEPPAPEHYPEYRPPNNPAGYTINAWMGPQGTYSPAHTDPYYNCYAQVVGSKHIWVAPPDCSPYLVKSNKNADEDRSDEDEDLQANAAAEHFMGNTALLDVFTASLDPSNATPDFRQHVSHAAHQAILNEGDLLFMPPKWWHAIKSLTRSLSVSMWF